MSMGSAADSEDTEASQEPDILKSSTSFELRSAAYLHRATQIRPRTSRFKVGRPWNFVRARLRWSWNGGYGYLRLQS